MAGRLFITLFIIFFLSFCATTKKERVERDKIQPPEISVPYLPQPEREKKIVIEGPREVFSFALREADVRDVLKAIGKQTNFNVVISPEVQGKITVDLKNVTLEKALEYILGPLNFAFKIEERTLYVSKPQIETKVYPVNYVALRKRGLSTLRGTTGTERTAKEEAIRIESETESDIFKLLEANLREFLSPDGKLILNKEASLVIVMDYPRNQKNIALFLEALQASIQRQVMIEARIIEVELNEASKEGVNWAYINAKWNDIRMNAEQILVSPQTRYFNIPRVPEDQLPAPPSQYFRFGIISGTKFEAFVDLLRTYGKVNIISNPRIATLNNQRAVIKVATEDVFFESSIVVTPGAPATATTTPRYVTVGLVLDVIPQIDGDGNITMNIHPVLTEKVGLAQSTQAGMTVTAPILAVREVDTLIRVKEGESVVIGGLIKDKTIDSETGLKGAMNLPLIGPIFKTKSKERVRTELVILLTPKIVYGKETL
ncbi:MAG: secretin and TonB N-terminal domain-containing protein [Desulfobacterota bacterium]|nr:secretin and TonB N-terminal domain-containing protein [Thermodesulfobacteriota bacterium]MDW8001580.1 secretin and TonB N-terminal domain-containing protein [Deltaproteobacteria bacterium]